MELFFIILLSLSHHHGVILQKQIVLGSVLRAKNGVSETFPIKQETFLEAWGQFSLSLFDMDLSYLSLLILLF